MAFTTVTLTGTFKDAAGVAQAGTLTFTLTAGVANSGQTVAPSPITVTLNGSGAFSQSLIATDDAGTTPQGVQYGVTEQISGAQPRDYFITISAANAPTVDLSALTPGDTAWL